LKRPDISEKFPNFENPTIPKLAKTKSSENSVFRREFPGDSQPRCRGTQGCREKVSGMLPNV